MFPKGDRPHLRYLLDKSTHLKYRRLMKTLNNSVAFESSDPAQFKLHAIEFSDKYGVAATLAAFGIRRSTFFYWKKKYKDSGNSLIDHGIGSGFEKERSCPNISLWHMDVCGISGNESSCGEGGFDGELVVFGTGIG